VKIAPYIKNKNKNP